MLENLRHSDNSRFNSIIFRRNNTQIFTNGGLFDSAMQLFPLVGAKSRKTPKPMFIFPSGAKVVFGHLERYTDCLAYQGSQIPLICFDELTHFAEDVFWYMFSRNRSDSGISGYIRATTNPDTDSWVRKFIAWWIGEDGYAIPERSGVIRWFIRVSGELTWGDSKQELLSLQIENGAIRSESFKNRDDFPEYGEKRVIYTDKSNDFYYQWTGETYKELITPKSVTFIASSLTDNAILMKNDPSYYSNLMALPYVQREQLLGGNWKVKAAAGLYFKRSRVNMLEELPNDIIRWVRAWDLAATEDRKGQKPEDGSAYTAGVLIGKRKNGRFVIADVINRRLNSAEVRNTVLNTARSDKAKYKKVKIRMNQDPGQAGKEQAEQYLKMLSGFSVNIERESGSKETRAEPFSAQWLGLPGSETGNVDVLIADWNDSYFSQLESFPEGKFKDMVDASSTGFNELCKMIIHTAPPETAGNVTRVNPWSI